MTKMETKEQVIAFARENPEATYKAIGEAGGVSRQRAHQILGRVGLLREGRPQRAARPVPCQCGGPKDVEAEQCRSCWKEVQRRIRLCRRCEQRRRSPHAEVCRPCYREEAAEQSQAEITLLCATCHQEFSRPLAYERKLKKLRERRGGDSHVTACSTICAAAYGRGQRKVAA